MSFNYARLMSVRCPDCVDGDACDNCQAITDGLKEIDRLRAEVARLQKEREGTCEWAEDEDTPYQTDCGHIFEFHSEPPHNWMKFCCYCGKSIRIVPYDELADMDDEEPVSPTPPTEAQEELNDAKL